MHPNASGQVRTGPSKPENFKKLARTSKASRKTRDKFAKVFANACFPLPSHPPYGSALLYTHRGGWVMGGLGRYISDPRAPTDIFLTIFGRTELIIGPSRAKNCEEFAVEVRFSVDPPKLHQKGIKRLSRPKNLGEKKICWPKIELTGIV